MAASVGNLAIMISGNSKPFNQTMANVKQTLNQFAAGRDLTMNSITIKPPKDSGGTMWKQMLGAGAAGGIAGALATAGIGAMKSIGDGMLGAASDIGHRVAEFLAGSFKVGMDQARQQFALNFLAGGPEKGGDWIKSIRSLSMVSGFGLKELHHSAQTLAGSFTDLDNVIPTLQRISLVSAGLGADSEQMNRFALAVTQVVAKGRFMAQELNQLTDAGLPLSEMAKTAGMSVGEFRKGVEDGQISANVLLQTLNRLTESGGRFDGMFTKIGGTPLGQIQRITSLWEQFRAELGMGMMDSAQKSGFLNALENGVNYLLDHKGELKSLIDDVAHTLQSWSIEIVRFGGHVYDAIDAIRVLWEMSENLRRSYRVSIAIMSGGMSEMVRMMGSGVGDFAGDFWSKAKANGWFTTGNKWADDLAKSFETVVKPAIADAMKPLTLPLELAPRLQKELDSIREHMREGVSPFDKFQTGMSDIRDMQKFFDAKTKMMQDQAMPLFDAAFKIGGQGGSPEDAGQLGRALAGVRDRFMDRDPMSQNPMAHFGQFQQIRTMFDEAIGGAGGFQGMTARLLLGNANQLFQGQNFKPGERDHLLAKNFGMLQQSLTHAIDTFPSAMEKGSMEAFSTISHAIFGDGQQQSTQQQIADTLKEAKRVAEKQAADVARIAQALKNLGVLEINLP